MRLSRRLGPAAVSCIVAALATVVTAASSASAWCGGDGASELLVERTVMVDLGARQVQALDISLQPFAESLAGKSAPAILFSGNQERPFEVDGDTFTDFQSAANRACDNQKNACADAANGGDVGIAVNDCDDQSGSCKDAARTATFTAFSEFVTSDADFDYFCDL